MIGKRWAVNDDASSRFCRVDSVALALFGFTAQDRRNGVWLEKLSEVGDTHDRQLPVDRDLVIRGRIWRPNSLGPFDAPQLIVALLVKGISSILCFR